jgi:sugar lactone lactonase YvrE
VRALTLLILVSAWAGCHDGGKGGTCATSCDMAGGGGGGGGDDLGCTTDCTGDGDMACAGGGCTTSGGDMACASGAMCGGSATNLCSDGDNCGVCGHSCQGGACAGGACQPVPVESARANPYDVATDGTNVYWSEHSTMNVDGSVQTRPVGGTGATPLATNQWGPRRIVVANGNLYWANYYAGEVWAIAPAPSGTTTQMVGASGQLGLFAVDAAHAYYILNGGTVISSVPLDGSKTSTVLTNPALPSQRPTALVSDGTNVYWINSNDQSIRSTPVAGGAASLVVDQLVQPGLLAVFGGELYFTTATTIAKVSTAGGTPAPLVSGFTSPVTALAVDADGLYWTHFTLGTVRRFRFADGALILVAESQANPQGIAVDASTIYWGNLGTIGMSDGAIMKAAK